MHKSNPFLFPSSYSLHNPSESMPPSPSSPPRSVASSTSSKNSPYKPTLNLLQSPASNAPSTYAPPASTGPCPACEFHNRRCSEKCYVASFFPPNEVHKFSVVDSVFGFADVINFLQANSNSSYRPLLLLLKDTTREDEREVDSGTKKYAQPVTNFPKELGQSMKSDHVQELIQGRELANQLKLYLSSASADTIRENLAQMILSSIERSLSVLNSSEPITQLQDDVSHFITASNDPTKPTGSMDRAASFDVVQNDAAKKRKTLPETKDHNTVDPENGEEEPFDNGYSWKKNEQKDALGAKYPRHCHKCIYENTHICGATEEMQRSDKDPNMFEVEYRGAQTCLQGQQPLPPPMWPEKQERQDNISSNNQNQQVQGTNSNDQLPPLQEPDISPQQPLELDLSL